MANDEGPGKAASNGNGFGGEAARDQHSVARVHVDSIFEVDRDGSFKIVPGTLERITGFSREELELLTLPNVVILEDQPLAMNAIESVFEGSPLTIQEVSLISEGGGSRPVELIMLPKRQQDKVFSAWGAVVDTGDRMALKDQVAALNEGQERMKEMLRDFVNVLSRDIRQPLTSILLILEMMESGHYGEMAQTSKEKTKKLIEMVERIKDILSDALEMSRRMGGDFRFEPGALSLKDTLEDALRAKDDVIQKKRIKLKKAYREKDTLVNADRKAIYQVVETLIGNAIASTPEVGEISIDIDSIDGYLQVAISDSGEGMADDVIETLFDRFDIDPGREGGVMSLGLGLFLSKRIITKHGGRIWCESFIGLGSTFFFTLPREGGG
ncbi:MAG: HAMP domain-containing sensor histidine kinase [Candidatus Thermoplasmatota archaeon]|nr:HAMP domain-containing sensor histidine kinase [Candidatus Thermoplasmatota archaeon]